MGIVDNPVEDGVGDGRLADHIVPLSDGQLGGDQGGFSSVALFEDFEKIEALLIVEAVGTPIIEEQQFDASKLVDEPRKAAVEACQSEVFEQTRHALIKHGMIEPGSLASKGATEPSFAGASRSSVTMPGVRRMRRSFTTRSIPASGSRWRLCTAGFSLAQNISSSSSVMARSR